MRRIAATTIALLALALPTGALAHHHYKDPGTCSIDTSTGDFVVTAAGFTPSTEFQYEIYSTPPSSPGAQDSYSVGGGQFTTDDTGSFTGDLGPLSFFMTVYPNETTLTFDVYPVNNQTADLTTVLGSCTVTP